MIPGEETRESFRRNDQDADVRLLATNSRTGPRDEKASQLYLQCPHALPSSKKTCPHAFEIEHLFYP